MSEPAPSIVSNSLVANRGHAGYVRDLISCRPVDRMEMTVAPDDSLVVAYARMRIQNASRLAVVENCAVIGVVDESDLLCAAIEDVTRLQARVREVMSNRIEPVCSSTPIAVLLPLFGAGIVPVVVDGNTFVGLVTHADVVAYLRRRARESAKV